MVDALKQIDDLCHVLASSVDPKQEKATYYMNTWNIIVDMICTEAIKRLLLNTWNIIVDVICTEAIKKASPSSENWKAKGIHVLSRLSTLASFPGKLHQTCVHMLEVTLSMVHFLQPDAMTNLAEINQRNPTLANLKDLKRSQMKLDGLIQSFVKEVELVPLLSGAHGICNEKMEKVIAFTSEVTCELEKAAYENFQMSIKTLECQAGGKKM
eukprot:2026886-Amphidinium_carterae.2